MADIDEDGMLEVIGGGRWYKHKHPAPACITKDPSASRLPVGRHRPMFEAFSQVSPIRSGCSSAHHASLSSTLSAKGCGGALAAFEACVFVVLALVLLGVRERPSG